MRNVWEELYEEAVAKTEPTDEEIMETMEALVVKLSVNVKLYENALKAVKVSRSVRTKLLRDFQHELLK